MKIIDGTNAVLGRLAVYAAKQALKGEEIAIVNCENIIITGNRKDILGEFKEKRSKVGSGQKGPKYSLSIEKIVKRTIRGMIPNHRKGRGKVAYQKIKCYIGTPSEFETSEKETFGKPDKRKFHKIGELIK